MTMHKNYINILHLYYNFRVKLINDAIIEMDCNMEDLVMVNVADDIDELCDVILTLTPRLHTAFVKKECEGCTLYYPRQHRCLHHVDEQTARIRIDQCLAKCTGELIIIVCASNNKPMPNIEASSLFEIHRKLIIDSFQIGNIGSVSEEEMLLNFMHTMDVFSYK